MNILIVEDQKEKSIDILNYLKTSNFKVENIHIRNSLRSGLKELINSNKYNLVLLDMSMPNFDVSEDDPIGGTPESFAGKEFLSQMKLRKLNIPVIVVTQYTTFARGHISLDEIDSIFKYEYSEFYCGSVYYSSVEDSWKSSLNNLISEAIQ